MVSDHQEAAAVCGDENWNLNPCFNQLLLLLYLYMSIIWPGNTFVFPAFGLV